MKNRIQEKYGGTEPKRRSLGFKIVAALTLVCIFAVLTGCQSDGRTNSYDVGSNPAIMGGTSTVPPSYSDSDSTPPVNNADQTPPAPDGTTPAPEGNSAATSLDITTLAKQVIAGKWGNGSDRVDALTSAGYNAKAVQEKVNVLLDIEAVAQQVIAGDWGSGQDRIEALTNAGYDAQKVQAEVDKMLANDTTSNQTGVTWHDEITEPIYEDQPVYKYSYMYTFTAVGSKVVSPQVTDASDYIYNTSADAESAAIASSAQTKALNAIRNSNYDASTLADCTYTITTSSKQTGTERVQTGTRIVQASGWY